MPISQNNYLDNIHISKIIYFIWTYKYLISINKTKLKKLQKKIH